MEKATESLRENFPITFGGACKMTWPCGHDREYERGDAYPGDKCPECGDWNPLGQRRIEKR